MVIYLLGNGHLTIVVKFVISEIKPRGVKKENL
jgi:hypothetical protein